jgi:hypothetical protein
VSDQAQTIPWEKAMLEHSPVLVTDLSEEGGLSKANTAEVYGSEVRIFNVSRNGAQHFIYADPESNVMVKRRTKKQQDKAILAEVIKEMAKPRVAMSAREHYHIVRKRL